MFAILRPVSFDTETPPNHFNVSSEYIDIEVDFQEDMTMGLDEAYASLSANFQVSGGSGTFDPYVVGSFTYLYDFKYSITIQLSVGATAQLFFLDGDYFTFQGSCWASEVYEVERLGSPEINVQGNSLDITNGDSTPSAGDDTDFGDVAVDGGTDAHTFTIENTGSGALNISGVTFSGGEAGDFSLTSTPASSVAGSGNTTFEVTFNPGGAGTRSTVVNIANDDSDENPYTFAIQGNGTVPEINVQGNSVDITNGDSTPSSGDDTDFGDVAVDGGTDAHVFTIQNTGDADLTVSSVTLSGSNPGDFSVSSSPAGTVGSGLNTSFEITFDPTAAGTRSADVNIANNDSDENPYTFTIQGNGTAPEINVQGNGTDIADGDTTPSAGDDTDFGDVAVDGGTKANVFTIENTGNANLTIGSVSFTGDHAADFSVTSTPGASVSASANTPLEITFDPSAAGTRNAEVIIPNNDSDENPYTFAIRGNGTVPEINIQGNGNDIADGDMTPSATDDTDFGNVIVAGGTNPNTFTIFNTGNAPLTIGTISFSGTHAGDFSVTSLPGSSVAAGGNTPLEITFDPSGAGTRNAVVSIVNNDADENPYTFALTGNGTAPEINVQGNSVDIADGDMTPSVSDDTEFGNVDVGGTPATHSFLIENTGNADLSISSVTLGGTNPGDFSISSLPAATVTPGNNTTFQVTFTPAAEGIRTAIVNIANDDSDENPYDFMVRGNGVCPEINVTGNSITIVSGDTTPEVPDDTDYGYVHAAGGNDTHSFTIENSGAGTLSISSITMSGTNPTDFSFPGTIPTSIVGGGNASFDLEFTPGGVGIRSAIVNIANNDSDENPYTFSVQGLGTPDITVLPGAGGTVPKARERMRYRVEIGCAFDSAYPLQAGDTVDWVLTDPAGTPVGPAYPLEIVEEGTGVDRKFYLQTKFEQTATDTVTVCEYIPEGWGNRTIGIEAERTLAGESVVFDTGSVTFTLEVEDTKTDVDIAILLDRSGSMSSHSRWQSALDGAQAFSSLMSDAVPGYNGRAGLYWFWGHNSNSFGHNYDPASDPGFGDAYPDAFYGPFYAGAAAQGYKIGDSLPASDPTSVGDLDNVHGYNPGHYTALGSGLLYCRDQLIEADPANTKQRVILLLSDGMENRAPRLNDVFTDPGVNTDNWYWKNAPGLPADTDPDVRVYASALLTGEAWAARLRDEVVTYTGGIPELDVHHIDQSGTYSMKLNLWFFTSFANLFNFDATSVIDPVLESNSSKTHTVSAHHGQDKLVFYLTHEDAAPNKWDFTIKAPGSGETISKDDLVKFNGSIKYAEGKHHKMFIVHLPLKADGYKHRWAGEWKMAVKRTGSGTGKYTVASLARKAAKRDISAEFEVISASRPTMGERAVLRCTVKDQKGKPVKDASVKTVITEPVPWMGNTVAKLADSKPTLVKRMSRLKGSANADMQAVSDRIIDKVNRENPDQPRSSSTYTLKHIRNGIYEKTVTLETPGEYVIDTTVTGVRKTTKKEVNRRIKTAKAKLKKAVSSAVYKKEAAYLKTFAGVKQNFRFDYHTSLNVSFKIDPKKSKGTGMFAGEGKIRLTVKPVASNNLLLGPGWAHAITFRTETGRLSWPAADNGDGTYQVEIKTGGRNVKVSDSKKMRLTAGGLYLTSPYGQKVKTADASLDLNGFSAVVLGVTIPITVSALIGNRKSKEVHLASCIHAAKIAEKNKEILSGLAQAKKKGYDTCEHCLPLICNTDSDNMEAHKPFCSHVSRIASRNRLEVNSWSAAKKLGFDGCKYCMKKYHTR